MKHGPRNLGKQACHADRGRKDGEEGDGERGKKEGRHATGGRRTSHRSNKTGMKDGIGPSLE